MAFQGLVISCGNRSVGGRYGLDHFDPDFLPKNACEIFHKRLSGASWYPNGQYFSTLDEPPRH